MSRPVRDWRAYERDVRRDRFAALATGALLVLLIGAAALAMLWGPR